jgi:dTDP-4-dehydrorhamnose 3,5-epimerase
LKLTPLELAGAFLVDPEPVRDDRGYFARQWCARELAEHGLDGRLAQASISFNRARHTLRGMHFAVAPAHETKLVSCMRGAIYDVLVDMRPGPTFCRWVGVELRADDHRAVYVPDGIAHGFLTLEDATEVQYLISDFYIAEAARGVRFDDPAFAIAWPARPAVISARDASYPDFAP